MINNVKNVKFIMDIKHIATVALIGLLLIVSFTDLTSAVERDKQYVAKQISNLYYSLDIFGLVIDYE